MMPADAIESWLRSKARTNALGSLFGGLGLLLVSAILLFVIFWIVYLIIYLAVDWVYPLSFGVRLGLSAGVLGLLFVANFLTDPRLSARLAISNGAIHKRPAAHYLPFGSSASTDDLPAPRSARAHVHFLGEIVLIGPRLATAGVFSLVHAWNCSRLDAAACAAVLALLVERDEAVSFTDIVAVIPAGHDVGTVLTQVQDIDGVRIVDGEPERLALYDDLRKHLRKRSRSGPAKRRKQRAPERDLLNKEKPLASLVLLLREPRDVDVELLAQVVNRLFGVNVSAGASDSTEFVVGEPPFYFAQFHERVFQIQSVAKPYFDDLDAAVKEIRELRLGQAVTAHRAWLAVVLMHEYAPWEQDPYWHIGKLLAALAPPDTLAVLWPDHMKIRLWDRIVKSKLTDGKPQEALVAPATRVPVVGIADDDPRMKAAVAEARQRWPEFVAAFKRRQSAQKFAVKMPIRDGEHLEYLWLTVLSVQDDIIHGKVDNEPVTVKTVQLGSELKISQHKLNDWLYTDGDELKGGFTIKVLQSADES